MARCIIKKNADVEELRRRAKAKGYILRSYRQADGSYKYTLRKNTYRKGFKHD